MKPTRHHTHPEPLWRDRANFVIDAQLREPGEREQLWTERLDDGRFRICCVPLFLYDVALGDIVEIDDSRTVTVVMPSERYVLRVFFDDVEVDHQMLATLTGLGCQIEPSASGRLFAIDCATKEMASQARVILQGAENAGRLCYETGWSA
jgi:hypothetical protein